MALLVTAVKNDAVMAFAGKRPGRAEVALMRAHAYLQAGNPDQALKVSRISTCTHDQSMQSMPETP